MKENMFKCTENQGFQLTFENGYKLSVQFGPYHYCEAREHCFTQPRESKFWESKTAEIAVFHPNGTFVPLDRYNDVLGHQTVEEVIKVACQIIEGKLF
jgi:hypothetical protein